MIKDNTCNSDNIVNQKDKSIGEKQSIISDIDQINNLKESYIKEPLDSYTLATLRSSDKYTLLLHVDALSRALKHKNNFIKDMGKNIHSIYENGVNYYKNSFKSEYCIDLEYYLIDDNLHNSLNNGYLVKSDITMKKNMKGVYLVVLRHLNKTGNILIYKYLYYPNIFRYCLMSYFYNIYESCIKNYDNIFIISSEFKDYNFDSNINNDFSSLKEFYHKTNKVGLYKHLVSNILIPITLDIDNISSLTDYSVKKDFYNVILQMLKPSVKDLTRYKIIFDKLKISLDDRVVDNYNLLERFVFIVEDLDNFKSKLKEKNYVVNGGPQPWRAQSDSLMNKISIIDNHFRDSLDRHNKYHSFNGNIEPSQLIPVSRFSYRNIHQNLGNVRYYTTKIDNKSNVVKTTLSNSNTKDFLLKSKLFGGTLQRREARFRIIFYFLDYFHYLSDGGKPEIWD